MAFSAESTKLERAFPSELHAQITRQAQNFLEARGAEDVEVAIVGEGSAVYLLAQVAQSKALRHSWAVERLLLAHLRQRSGITLSGVYWRFVPSKALPEPAELDPVRVSSLIALRAARDASADRVDDVLGHDLELNPIVSGIEVAEIEFTEPSLSSQVGQHDQQGDGR